jgi:hypothetical protein
MPTIGQLKYCLAGSGADFVCDDFVALLFFREGDAVDFAFRFAAMRPVYVRVSLCIAQAAIVLRYPPMRRCWRDSRFEGSFSAWLNTTSLS